MGSAAGLVVEFVGLPGAGKSALSRQVADLLRAEGSTVSEPTARLDQSGAAWRTLAKVGYGIISVTASPLNAIRWMRTFVTMKQRGLSDLGRVGLNWFFLAGLTRALANRPGVHLLDQGIVQGLWSAAYGAREKTISGREIVAALLASLPPRILVIVVETSPDIVRNRLHARAGGDSRLERDLTGGESDASLTRAIAAFASMQELVELLERQGAIAVMRVQGEQPGQLQIAAKAVAARITRA
jgi:predicted kinase